jgi:N6-L-threonylcarbamoyladenine synthase
LKILAIETSCDETGVAILECTGVLPQPNFKVLANSLLSQIDIHKEYGGVFPMLAKREHEKNLPILLDKTLKESGIDQQDLDYIAVTAGPGLEPALWAGIVFAEEFGKKWGKPVVPINHMEGHLFSFLFDSKQEIHFPAIALLVSGGHTELVLVESFESFKILGQTKDDAVGEAFDKTARLLGLEYPGGPKISQLAERARARTKEDKYDFPRPMLKSGDYDFSYSGLKTAVLYTVKKIEDMKEETKEDLARSFEEAAIEPLIHKTKRAVEDHAAKSIILGGGVSSNTYLQKEILKLGLNFGVDIYNPKVEVKTDNAIMIGISAYVRHLTNRLDNQKKIEARGNLSL